MSLQLVTGGSGLLGRAVVKRLLDEGLKVRVYDIKEPLEEFCRKVEFHQGDIRDSEKVVRACEGCEVIYHLAANMPQARLSEQGFWEMNVGGTLNALEGALRYGARRFVFASTIEIYGIHTEFPVLEESEKRFTGIYSRNKWECEQRLLDARQKHKIEVVFLRMPMIFGPGFWHEKSMLMMFRLIHYGLPVPVPGFPKALWACVSSEDAAEAFFLAGRVKEADGEAFNIQAEITGTYLEVLKEVIRLAGSGSRAVVISGWLVERAINLVERYDLISTPPELVRFAMFGGDYSIAKAKRILGFKPKHSSAQAIYSAYQWLYPKG